MMTIQRWTPFRSWMDIQKEVSHLFDDVLANTERDVRSTPARWAPIVDIYEDDGSVVLQVEVPGVKREDIDIQVADKRLTLRGKRQREENVKEESYQRAERYFGTFSRSFTLPQHVDVNQIKAGYEDGILTVTLPKTEEAKPKKVSIN